MSQPLKNVTLQDVLSMTKPELEYELDLENSGMKLSDLRYNYIQNYMKKRIIMRSSDDPKKFYNFKSENRYDKKILKKALVNVTTEDEFDEKYNRLEEKENPTLFWSKKLFKDENGENAQEYIDNGANPDFMNGEILKRAIENNNLEFVQLLLENDADPNIDNGAVFQYVSTNEMIELLIKYGGDVEKGIENIHNLINQITEEDGGSYADILEDFQNKIDMLEKYLD